MHVYLPRTSKAMHMSPDVFGLSNTKPNAYAGMQSCIEVMMW